MTGADPAPWWRRITERRELGADGHETTFDCGHAVISAVPLAGDMGYCARCAEEILTAAKWKSQILSTPLYAWVGFDELGSGEVGLKQGHCPAGLIPIVSVNRNKAAKFIPQMQAQAVRYGKKIALVRFRAEEIIAETDEGGYEITRNGME